MERNEILLSFDNLLAKGAIAPFYTQINKSQNIKQIILTLVRKSGLPGFRLPLFPAVPAFYNYAHTREGLIEISVIGSQGLPLLTSSPRSPYP